ncbi:MAG: OmpA family protein [Desulfobacterales bacterium]|nr:OmpA family protein [Desulfobacterales bacterium]
MARKKKAEKEKKPPDLLLVMNIALFIILLAFFILLNSLAVVSEDKTLAAIGSLRGSFGSLTGDVALLPEVAGDLVSLSLSPDIGLIDLSSLFVGKGDFIENIYYKAHRRGTLLIIPSNLLFEDYGMKIKESSYKLLEALSISINKNDYPVEILGHMDNIPMPDEYKTTNLELTSIRSLSVLKYFISKGNVQPDRITAYGCGEYNPVVSNQTKESRELNNRMEILFVHKKKTDKPNGIYTYRDFFFNIFN